MFNETTWAAMRVATRAMAQIVRRRRAREPARELPATITAIETSAAAYAFGYIHGRARRDDGSADLFARTALRALSYFSGDEYRLAPHARALRTGALAAYAYRRAVDMDEHSTSPREAPAERPVSDVARESSSVTMELTVVRITMTAHR